MISASAAMDRIRWHKQYIENGMERSQEEEIAFLSDYILMRKAFLDKAWIEQIPVHQITLLTESTVYETLYVLDGEPLPDLPEADFNHAQFLRWRTEDGSSPDIGSPVHADMVFHADLQY